MSDLSESITELCADWTYKDDPAFDTITRLVVISRHWAAGDRKMCAEFAAVMFKMLMFIAGEHGYEDFDQYLDSVDADSDEGTKAHAIWHVMQALMDDEAADAWEAATPPAAKAEFLELARTARALHPDGVQGLEAMIEFESRMRPGTN